MTKGSEGRSETGITEKLEEIASVLDRALGDSDITHIESDEELRERAPVQWACSEINKLLSGGRSATVKPKICRVYVDDRPVTLPSATNGAELLGSVKKDSTYLLYQSPEDAHAFDLPILPLDQVELKDGYCFYTIPPSGPHGASYENDAGLKERALPFTPKIRRGDPAALAASIERTEDREARRSLLDLNCDDIVAALRSARGEPMVPCAKVRACMDMRESPAYANAYALDTLLQQHEYVSSSGSKP